MAHRQSGPQPSSAASDECALLAAARAAALLAYAPYSHFRVGAAVSAGGMVYAGCNVENASYGLSICAERAAIVQAIAAGHRRVEAIAVACIDAPVAGARGSLMPCGACRQVIAEFGAPDTLVFVDGAGSFTLDALLPEAFRL